MILCLRNSGVDAFARACRQFALCARACVAKSSCTSATLTPCSDSFDLVSANFSLDSSSALLGMQPMRKHVPPNRGSVSTQAAIRPSCEARMAAVYPPGPPPITIKSNCDMGLNRMR